MLRTPRALTACAAALACALATGLTAAGAAAHVIPLAPLTGVSIGPVLVGESTVWGHSIYNTQDMVLQFATPAGETKQVLHMNGTTTCDRIEDVVGSPAAYVVTVVRIARDGNSNCLVFERRLELLVGRPGSAALTPLPAEPGGGCAPYLADVDGDHLALLRGDCPGREIAVLDLRTGVLLAELPFDSNRTFRATQMAIGGRHLALTGVSGELFTNGQFAPDISPRLFFYDWPERREVAVVNTSRPGRETTNGDDRLAIDENGVAVISTLNLNGPLGGPLMEWMSPAAPVPHAMPVNGYNGGRLNMQDGAVALVRAQRQLIVGVDGRTRLDLGPLGDADLFFAGITWKDQDGYGIDIDDGRIALERYGSIVNDTLPPALPEAAVKRPSARAGLRVIEGRLTPSVIAPQRVEVAIVQLADGLRPGTVRAGAAATAAKPRRCKQASSRGRLTTFKPRDGRCVPTRFLRAKGTTSWRLTLPRRLPRGRYAVYARAVDIAGRVGRVAAKDALTVRVR